MNIGFNENVLYKGSLYHVQTEDGGASHPFITTVVFIGGCVVASKKTGYAGVINKDGSGLNIREMMKGQHARVVKELLDGRFDELKDNP